VSALLIVGACVAWGIDNSATSRVDQIAPHHVTFLKGVVAGTVNLLLALTVTGPGAITVWSLLGALAVGALGYGASITLWVRGAQQLGAARGQAIFASAPFLGAIVAWVALSDPVEPVQVVTVTTVTVTTRRSSDAIATSTNTVRWSTPTPTYPISTTATSTDRLAGRSSELPVRGAEQGRRLVGMASSSIGRALGCVAT
jgi:hypothetical protein